MPRFGGSASRGFGASGGFPGGRGSAVAILEYAAQERIVAQYLYEHAGAPTDGTNGTYANVALPGALLIDTDAKTLYQNTGTQASPVWTERSASGGGVAVPLSVTSSHAIEVLAIDDLGGTTHRQESGQNFSVFHAAEDVAHQYYPFQVGDSGITFNLNDFFNSVLEIRSRSSTSRRLLQAGWNDSAEIILGFAAGKVGFFGKTGVTRPQVPASPTVQDVVDALKALGLITQAA
jgi:hypothetical protein